jgi:hypothetical protein
MNIAVVSESSADEDGLRIVINAILPAATFADGVSLRRRGWPAVIREMPVLLRGLHYNFPHVDALVVVVDSDDSPIHKIEHDGAVGGDPQCRLCALRDVTRKTLSSVRAVANRAPLRVAIGLAVPAIEAWYQAVRDPQASEAAWLSLTSDGKPHQHRRKQLKRDAYGVETLFGPSARNRTIEAAERVTAHLGELERLFPNGFAPLARALRSW